MADVARELSGVMGREVKYENVPPEAAKQALMKAEKEAASKSQLVLGFYHSHPDHPARPSEFDREHAWPFYSYVIVSIQEGQALDMTSWVLDDASRTFSRQEIEEV